MKFKQEIVVIKTLEPTQLIDITSRAREFCRHTDIKNGLLTVSSLHTTACVRINEKCSELDKDLFSFFDNLIPRNGKYAHNVVAIDGRPNAHSHLLSFLIPRSETIVIEEGELQLGSWQTLFFLELDGPRAERKVSFYALGE